MGLVKEVTWAYEEPTRSHEKNLDLRSGQKPSEWVKMVMKEARRAER
jgi:hypothetical protein